MSEQAEKLKVELSRLSSEERSEIADFLLDGLEAEENGGVYDEADFKAELMRRWEEIESGQEVGIPIEDALRELREKYPRTGIQLIV